MKSSTIWHAFVLTCVACTLMLSLGVRAADDDVIVDGDTGVLSVSGELTQGACNVETTSWRQTIDMGVISSGELAYPGAQGKAKAVHLHLRDCISGGLTEGEAKTGTVVRTEDQPEVRVSFVGQQDVSNPALIAVQGAEGFGLRLEDRTHHTVVPGELGEPLVVSADNAELTYWLVPERTRAALQDGAWRSAVYMRLSYE